MSSKSSNPAGRPPAKILTEHFNQLEKVDNKSNRQYYECKYCGLNGAGACIEGRDNQPLKHIIFKCQHAPQAAKNGVHAYLAVKAPELLPEPVKEDLGGATAGEEAESSPLVLGKAAKRPREGLMGYIDVALTPAQQDHANFKLFLSV
ncbi:hypothetical protein BKA82DRAFT_4350601 [Pisolithus tinctorius]|nr:hypothetical protein BKA82DRAFT_4350601 [Pisolithus tinctorius]